MVTDITNRLSVPDSSTTTRVSTEQRVNKSEGVAIPQGRQVAAEQGQQVSQINPAQNVNAQSDSRSPLSEAVSNINSFVQSVSRDLQFSIDESTDRVVVKVLDSETEEVIREIPSEEVLALARHLSEQQESESKQLEGLIIQVQA